MKKTPQDSSRRGRKDELEKIAQAISLYIRVYDPQKHKEVFYPDDNAIPSTAEILQKPAHKQLAESPELLTPLKQLQAAQEEAESALFASRKADKKRGLFKRKKTWGETGLELTPPAADFEPFIRHVRFFGPLLFCSLSGPNRLLWWWIFRWMDALRADKEELREAARRDCAKIAQAVRPWGLGRKEMTQLKQGAIIAKCKRWYPIYEDLNKAFRAFWQQDKYRTSEFYRKEKRGELAEKHKISIAEVKKIESHLGGPPPISKKITPTEAMWRRVAMECYGIGAKTVENIWSEYTKNHPDRSGKKRRRSPTPVAERTA